jgi:hypothetical protein
VIIYQFYFRWTCCYPEFNITDAAGTNQFFIHGPVCPCKCYHDVEFPVGSLLMMEMELLCIHVMCVDPYCGQSRSDRYSD